MTALGPDFIALQVRDLEASAAFYTTNLGLVRAPVSPEHAVVFATEPITFAVREPLVDLDAVEHLGWGVLAAPLSAHAVATIADHGSAAPVGDGGPR
jgi:catechol 2,3-dioxygenase-like lactoylglutathione lyase family enzyme